MLRTIFQILLNLLLIAFAYFLLFSVWWTNDDSKYIGILAYFLIGFCALTLSFSVVKLFFSDRDTFSYKDFLDKTMFNGLAIRIGKFKANTISYSSLVIFLVIVSASIYVFVQQLNRYESKQLKTFGTIQKVRIHTIDYLGKGSPFAFFDFYMDNKVYKDRIGALDLKVGDSIRIIFSREHPEILKLESDYLKLEE